MPKFVLASTSPRRLRLLEQIGYKPDIIHAPDIDETPLTKELPSSLVKRLAYEKALKATYEYPDDIVLAADTIVAKGRRILGKPADQEEAYKFLDLLSGHRHKVFTGISVIYKDKVFIKSDYTVVKFKRLSDEEKRIFIATKEWEGKSGAYSIQGFANAFIEKIIGSDTTVVGLNLNTTYKILLSLGFKPNNL
jgi:septum formation protein